MTLSFQASKPVTPPLEPPCELVRLTEQLTRQIRRGSARGGCAGSSGDRYRQLVLESMTDAVAAAFPLFWRCQPAGEPARLTEIFLASHGAMEPQFSWLAQDFVRFMQPRLQKKGLSLPLALLEYEWLLLRLRRTGPAVPDTRKPVKPPGRHERLKANPTLVCAALPFSPATLPWTQFPAPAPLIVYAIFRDTQHKVTGLPLRADDQAFVQAIMTATDGIEVATLNRRFTGKNCSRQLSAWLDLALGCDLVQVVPKGESDDTQTDGSG